VTICLDRMLPYGSSGQPGDGPGVPVVPLFGLAPDGVFLSRPVTRPPVSSYLAISPLLPKRKRYVSVALFRRVAPPGCYPASCPRSSDFPLRYSRSGHPFYLGHSEIHSHSNIENCLCQGNWGFPTYRFKAKLLFKRLKQIPSCRGMFLLFSRGVLHIP